MKNTRQNRLLAFVVALLVLLPLTSVPAFAETIGVARNPNGGSFVNVRMWPGYDADVISTVPVGESVTVTGSTGTWYSVWVNGVVGYIHANFLSVSGGGDGFNATVRSGPLNVREAASMRARVITQLPTGYRVQVVSQDGTWSEIQFGTTIGFVASSYLTTSGGSDPISPEGPVTTPNANATIATRGSRLNLRSYAGSSAPILGSYANGSRVRVLARGNSWSRVQVAEQTGYMSTQYLAFDSGSGGGYSAVVNNPGAGQVLNLRAEPSGSSRSLGQYRNGTAVTVLGVGTEWNRVRVDGVQGYMMSKYLRMTSSGATPHKTVRGGANGFVNLRSGAGYNYGVVMQVSNGAAVSVVVPYPTWSQVVVRSGSGYQSGYMLNSFLR